MNVLTKVIAITVISFVSGALLVQDCFSAKRNREEDVYSSEAERPNVMHRAEGVVVPEQAPQVIGGSSFFNDMDQQIESVRKGDKKFLDLTRIPYSSQVLVLAAQEGLLHDLEHIDLSCTDATADDVQAIVQGCPYLKSLYLVGCRESFLGIVRAMQNGFGLINLKFVDLRETGVSLHESNYITENGSEGICVTIFGEW